MARFLVTGAAGFIGSSLVKELVRAGERVRALDRREDFSLIEGLAGVEQVVADVRDPVEVGVACRGVEVVLHHAALVSVPVSIDEPRECDAINAGGTVTLLDAAHRSGVRRFVLASSAAVYGDAPELPKNETMLPRPRSPYAASKLAAELYLETYAALHGIETVSLRYFNVFGPGQRPEGAYAAAIPRFCAAALKGERITVYGDGEATRDFCYVSDVVRANLLAASVPARLAGERLNVATGRTATINQIVDAVRAAVGHDLDVVHAAPRAGDIRHSTGDATRASELLGWRPSIAWQDGIAPTLEWLRTLP